MFVCSLKFKGTIWFNLCITVRTDECRDSWSKVLIIRIMNVFHLLLHGLSFYLLFHLVVFFLDCFVLFYFWHLVWWISYFYLSDIVWIVYSIWVDLQFRCLVNARFYFDFLLYQFMGTYFHFWLSRNVVFGSLVLLGLEFQDEVLNFLRDFWRVHF